MDTLVYPLTLISPIMTIPQISDIWMHKNVGGISLITWSAYTVVSSLWFIYGIQHKEKPIIISSSLLFIVELLVVFGVLLYR